MSDDTSLADDISAAMSGSSATSDAGTSAATADSTASTGTATTQPADAAAATPGAVQTTQSEGPIPFQVHKTALENARTKAAQEADARWQQQHGWATQIDQREFQQVQQLARTLSANPIEGLQQLIAEVRKDPRYDAELKSLAARALQHGRGQQQAGPDLHPIQVAFDNGQTVGMYTADQIAALQQQWQAQMRQEFQPVTKTIETLQKERAAAEHAQQVTHFATSMFADVRTWAGMETKEAQATLAAELAKANIDPDDPREVAIAMDRAYRRLIVPTLNAASRQAALHDVTLKAQTNTVSPHHQSTGAPKPYKDMSWGEAFRSELAARK